MRLCPLGVSFGTGVPEARSSLAARLLADPLGSTHHPLEAQGLQLGPPVTVVLAVRTRAVSHSGSAQLICLSLQEDLLLPLAEPTWGEGGYPT